MAANAFLAILTFSVTVTVVQIYKLEQARACFGKAGLLDPWLDLEKISRIQSRIADGKMQLLVNSIRLLKEDERSKNRLRVGKNREAEMRRESSTIDRV